jgi:hypothetical protein
MNVEKLKMSADYRARSSRVIVKTQESRNHQLKNVATKYSTIEASFAIIRSKLI